MPSVIRGAADFFLLYDEKRDLHAVHRCTSCHSQMPISPFTDAHLYVYRCRAVKLPQACGKAAARQR